MEYTRFNYHQVFEMNAVEFLNVLSYMKSKILNHNEEVKKQAREMRRKHGR